MSGNDPRACPDPGVLGAFVEKKLHPADQAHVHRHLLTCNECLIVIREANLHLMEETNARAARARPRSLLRAVAVAAAVLVVCTMLGLYAVRRADPLWRLRALSADVPLRPIEGRLAGFPHGELQRNRTGVQSAVPVAIRAEAERVRTLTERDARTLHARGIAALLIGNTADAIALLERVVRLEPGQANNWSDLSAAYIASANEHPGRLHAARTAAERAVSLDPHSPAAYFNLGLAAVHLRQHGAAIAAFDRAMEYDRDREWAAEADARRSLLQNFR